MLGLVGGAPGGETQRVADSSVAGACRVFHNSVPSGARTLIKREDSAGYVLKAGFVTELGLVGGSRGFDYLLVSFSR